jgi:hypothetical protein
MAVLALPWARAAEVGLPAGLGECPGRAPRVWDQWAGPGRARMTDYAGCDSYGSCTDDYVARVLARADVYAGYF